MSVVGEIYAIVPGESERTLLGGLLHAWLTYAHGVYIYIYLWSISLCYGIVVHLLVYCVVLICGSLHA